MNRLLKPRHLDLDSQDPFAARDWKHWKRSFDNFIIECDNNPAPDKYRAIQNQMLPHVYEMVEDCLDYDSVVKTLDKLYIKTPNVIFARHRLATRHQQGGVSLAKYLQELKRLSKDCKL